MQKRRKFQLGGIVVVLLLAVGGAIALSAINRNVDFAGMIGAGQRAEIQLPPGFHATIFAEGLDGPRFLAFDSAGILHVADRGNNRIVALPDANEDGMADGIRIFANEVPRVHSIVYHEEAWFAGVPNGVIRLADTDADGVADSVDRLIGNYPSGGHSTRTVEFLPDGRMVVSVGSSCNVCEEEDPRRAAIVIYDGSSATGERIFASGLRNAVGLASHPTSGELWATNNGRDLMGDDLPPETVYIVEDGADYGWPRCHNGWFEDPQFGFEGSCADVAAPVTEMQAHSAPLGLAFYTGTNFPEEYWGDLFIAFHGSWNRSIPTGYNVVRLSLNGSAATGPVEDFATGWLDESTEEVTGRPVGLAVGPDGALYVSDDKGGIIYRIVYAP